MKKLALFLLVVVFSLTQLVAQSPSFIKGDKVLNLGIGMGSASYSGFNLAPIFSTSFEVGIVDNIVKKAAVGVGGFLAFSSHKYSDNWRYSNFIFGGRGTFHYPLVNNLDTYAGLMLGYNIYSEKWLGNGTEIGSGPSSGGFVSILNAGVRYYFSNSFAAMSELGLGYGSIYLNLGIALKF